MCGIHLYLGILRLLGDLLLVEILLTNLLSYVLNSSLRFKIYVSL